MNGLTNFSELGAPSFSRVLARSNICPADGHHIPDNDDPCHWGFACPFGRLSRTLSMIISNSIIVRSDTEMVVLGHF